MDQVLAFLSANWANIVLAVLIVVGLVVLFVSKRNKLVLQFMIMAEKKAKERSLETGESKLDFVIEGVLSRLPLIVRVFVTKDMLETVVEKLLKKAYDYVDDGSINGSWTEEKKEEIEQEVADEATAVAEEATKDAETE